MDIDNEESESGTNNDILDKEIESWKGFEYALREENALLFNKMLSESREYAKAVTAKGEPYQAELLFMALILQQQRMMSPLMDSISKEGLQQKNRKNNKSRLSF